MFSYGAKFWLPLLLMLVLSPLPAYSVLPPEKLQLETRGEITSFLQDGGLTQAKIFDVAFEQNGVVWLAVSDGLYRYDGYLWDRFSTESGLPGVFVRCVLVTQNQKIWVGTDRGAGIFENGKFRFMGDASNMAGPSVRRMKEDPDGTIWFCHDAWPDLRTPSGLSAFKDGKWHLYGAGEGLSGTSLLNYFRTQSGEQFATTGNPTRSQVFRKNGEHWEPVEALSQLIWSMSEHPQLGVLGIHGPNLAAYKDGQWTLHPCAQQQGMAFTVTRAGEVLACTSSASQPIFINRWNGTAFVPASPPLPVGAGFLEGLKEAPDGAIWCIGDNVLSRWSRGTSEWTHFPDLPEPRGLNQQGKVWFAAKGEAVLLKDDQLHQSGLPSEFSMVDREGNLWTWSEEEIVRTPSEPSEKAARFPVNQTGLNSIEGLVMMADGEPCIFDHEHYSTFDPLLRWTRHSIPKGANAKIDAVSADPLGGLWFMILEPSGKLTAIHSLRQERHEIDPGAVGYGTEMVADTKGGFWLFGISGLYYWPLNADHWEKIPGLGGGKVLSAVQGDKHLWFAFDSGSGGRNGFGFFDGQTWHQTSAEVTGFATRTADGDLIFAGADSLFSVRHEDLSDVRRLSFPSSEMEVRSVVKDRDGSLWIGLTSRAAGNSTFHYHSDGVPPVVRFFDATTEVRHDGRLRATVQTIERLQIHTKKKGYRFSTRVDQDPWSAFNALAGADISVNGLQPGRHELSIRCRDEAGEISTSPAQIAFTVLPTPLELRTWFRPAALALSTIIALLALVAAQQAYRFRLANVLLTKEIIEKKEAQGALQQANDELERRVEERSAQLEEQITVRQKAEGEFAATLAERNRLGREIHDTLEQSLAAVGLQLAAAKMLSQAPERAEHHLDLAANVLRQSQVELRRSVLDLRSQALEKFDLATALSVAARQLTEGSKIGIKVRTSGEPRRFSATVENGLLRIGQEALTNAFKHAQATQMIVELEFQATAFCLRIKDNGRGFNTQVQLLPDDGHFGLQGMQERADRLGGELHLTSQADGTTVEVMIPIPSLNS